MRVAGALARIADMPLVHGPSLTVNDVGLRLPTGTGGVPKTTTIVERVTVIAGTGTHGSPVESAIDTTAAPEYRIRNAPLVLLLQ